MIYVSLTTIPSRVKGVEKTIDSLLNQTQKPDKIFINIPVKFKRFDETIDEKIIPKFNSSIIELVRCEDFGPGTKLLGPHEKLKENSLIILVDDDNYYANYMIEKFHEYYLLAPENAYSFYVHPLNNFGIGQGADGFAINTNALKGIKLFFKKVVLNNKEIFIHDDLWISFYLFYIKKIKILSLQEHIKKNDKDSSLIYKSHNDDMGLISHYGNNLKEAIIKRDKKATESIEYMFEKIKEL